MKDTKISLNKVLKIDINPNDDFGNLHFLHIFFIQQMTIFDKNNFIKFKVHALRKILSYRMIDFAISTILTIRYFERVRKCTHGQKWVNVF